MRGLSPRAVLVMAQVALGLMFLVASGDPAFRPEDAIEFWDVTNRQDWDIVARSQLGIASRRYVPGPYSARESIPAAWDRAYLSLMGDETA